MQKLFESKNYGEELERRTLNNQGTKPEASLRLYKSRGISVTHGFGLITAVKQLTD